MRHIVLVTRSSRFPKGMAASQRITMIGRAIQEGGDSIRVLCLVPLDRDNSNPLPARGEHQGIDYEYTSGTATRSKNFWRRRWHRMKGAIVALCRILQYRRERKLDCLYVYDRSYNLNYMDLLFIAYARLLGFSVIREMNERPWSLKDSPSLIERAISPLRGVNAVIAISQLIKQWVESENRRRRKTTAVVHIPILTDVNEATGPNDRSEACYVLFAGSPAYDETMRFIFDAMETVWRERPDCYLYLTGFGQEDPDSRIILEEIGKRRIKDRMRIWGYLRRQELFAKYANARALLIPLFDDTQSRARFPTKISEYLASSAPVITNCVGEIPAYMEDGRDAFIAKPGDPAAFGQKILECLRDPERAKEIARRGRLLAERHFHYASYTRALRVFLNTVKR